MFLLPVEDGGDNDPKSDKHWGQFALSTAWAYSTHAFVRAHSFIPAAAPPLLPPAAPGRDSSPRCNITRRLLMPP